MPDTALDHPHPSAAGLPLVLSPTQLAEVMGVPVKTVYLWNSAGTAPTAMRLGKHIRYRREDVEAWMAQRVGALGAA